MDTYDLIIVGCGLYGATIAFKAKQYGLRCLILERRSNIGGNIRDMWQEGINVHQYGAHIFHTNYNDVWTFVNQFSSFMPYIHTVFAHNNGKLYHLPFCMSTFYDVYGISKIDEIRYILEEEHKNEYYYEPKNLEEKIINLVGRTVYEILVKGYTEKQWGKSATELPADIISRIPIRQTFDNRYFNDRYQGIPEQGYTFMINQMIKGIEVKTNVDFNNNKEYWIGQSKQILYTGSVDELLDYQFGNLEYRSLEFETEYLEFPNYQGTSVINETNRATPFTRTIEHKHFNYNDKTPHTIITREYPKKWSPGMEAYYPINDEVNNKLYKKYIEVAKERFPSIFFGGRMATYQYFDMDDTVKEALDTFDNIIRQYKKI